LADQSKFFLTTLAHRRKNRPKLEEKFSSKSVCAVTGVMTVPIAANLRYFSPFYFMRFHHYEAGKIGSFADNSAAC